jgi:zinc/manganese transport system substrate-binding protein
MNRLLPLLLASLALLAGCGDDDGGSGGGLSVVATTTQAADLVRDVGGERVDVHQVLQPNSDPHEYEPRPSDAREVTDADLVVRSGGDIDEWLDGLLENAGVDATTVTLIDSVRARPDDPHWWQDPLNGVLAVEALRDALIDADPDGRQEYERRAAAYVARLRALDGSIQTCIDEIPRAKRKLVTTHDALSYYADRYGLEVIGALIPSLSTQAQPSAKDTEELVAQIRDEGVEAIFPESSLNPKLEEAVSRETGAKVGAALYADTLGPEGSPGGTYIGSLQANTERLVDGLSGGRTSCTPDTRRAG